MNTARVYTGIAGRDRKPVGDSDGTRPGSVKKQKQQRKQQDCVLAKQNELSALVVKLEDRDTQQQAFTSLLELLPRLDAALVRDLYTRIEKNKSPGRSSTRRMFVLVLAALCKCHPLPSARLLPRVLQYMSLRLRDKEAQITDACVILCSAIVLYVVPFACVNAQGSLSPRKKATASDPSEAAGSPSPPQTYEAIVNHLARETNAVGELATKCIASIISPVEFNGTSQPPLEAIRHHGEQITPFLATFFASLVSKLNESRQFTCFSSTFLLLQATVSLAKTLQLQCDDARVSGFIRPRLAELVDAVEDVFRDAPRDDWVLRKRGIELWIQLLDLFVLGGVKDDGVWAFVDTNFERLRRLVMEARHDPVSTVRDAALPAVFQFDQLIKLFPRTEGSNTSVAPTSPFRRVYHPSDPLSSSRVKTLSHFPSSAALPITRKGRRDQVDDAEREAKEVVHESEDDFEGRGGEGDEASAPMDDEREVKEEQQRPQNTEKKSGNKVPELGLTTVVAVPPSVKHTVPRRQQERQMIPRLAPAKSEDQPRREEREWFQPLAVPSQSHGDDAKGEPHQPDDKSEIGGEDDDDGDHAAPPSIPVDQDSVSDPAPPFESSPPRHSASLSNIGPIDDESDLVEVSRSEAAVLAAAEGEVDLALRLAFLEDDLTLLKKVLALTPQPCMAKLSRASRTALCAAFLELLEDDDDDGDVWVVFAWLEDLSRHRRLVHQLDPRVLRAMEKRLTVWAETPSKAGQVAADLLTKMGI